jgi:hypothetical protein
VPADKQDAAVVLYEEGNTLFGQQAHQPAMEKYKAALALWDHPLIRFNLAVTEIRLERAQPMSRQVALRRQALQAWLYQQALDYQALSRARRVRRGECAKRAHA